MNDSGSATEQLAASLAAAAATYGMPPLAGRLYAMLFLAPEPLSLGALAEGVGAARSGVSVALRELEHGRLIRRLPPRGDRRAYYEVSDDPWSMVLHWLRHGFIPEIQALSGAVERASRGTPDDAPLRGRLADWAEFLTRMRAALDDLERTAEAHLHRRHDD